MQLLETLTLHTIPAGGHDIDEVERADFNVVGIETNERTIWREATLSYEPGKRTPATKEPTTRDLEVPSDWAERLVAFFDRYIRDGYTTDRYNCHRFAFWMTGSAVVKRSGFLNDDPELLYIVQEGVKINDPAADPPSFNQHLVIADTLAGCRPDPLHSLIGLGVLGENLRQCIQVSQIDGPLQLCSIAYATKLYDLYPSRTPDRGLYGIPQPGS